MYNEVIVYPNDQGWLSVIIPAPECGLSIEEIAKKDVPTGRPYHIVDYTLLPDSGEDLTFFTAWEANFDNPTGYGE